MPPPPPRSAPQLAALRHRDEVVPAVVEEYRRRVTYAAQRINALPGMRVLEPQGTFYLFPCVKPSGLTSAQATELLAKAGVLVVPAPLTAGRRERATCASPAPCPWSSSRRPLTASRPFPNSEKRADGRLPAP